MKKRSSLIMALMMIVAVMLASCGSDDPVTGTWNMTKTDINGDIYTVEELQAEGYEGEMAVLEVGTDGEVSLTYNGESDGSGTISGEDGKYVIEDDASGKEINVTLEGDELLMELEGMDMIFEKSE